jgi:predicted RNase H-like HicB family nuclease
MELGSYSLAVDGKEYQLIVEKAPQGYSARIPTVPECTTVAASATEAVSKAQRKLLAHLRDGG